MNYRVSRTIFRSNYRLQKSEWHNTMLSMELAGILRRIESRLKAVGLTATKASKLAGKPDSIRNIRRAVKEGRRSGVSTSTLQALAPVLKTTQGWLLTGMNGGEDGKIAGVVAALPDETVSLQDVVTALTWAFQKLEGAVEAEARMVATAIATLIHTQRDQSGSPLSPQDKRRLIELAVEFFRSKRL